MRHRDNAQGCQRVSGEVVSRLQVWGLLRAQAGGRRQGSVQQGWGDLGARWWGPPHLAEDAAQVIAILGIEELGLGEPRLKPQIVPG